MRLLCRQPIGPKSVYLNDAIAPYAAIRYGPESLRGSIRHTVFVITTSPAINEEHMREKIMTFLNLTGLAKYPDVIAEGYTAQIRSQFMTDETLPDAFAKAIGLMTSTLEAKKDALFNTVISAYEKSFTEEELDALVAFYGSPVGRRVVELGGIVLPEVVAAGETWGAEALMSIQGALAEILA